MYTSFEKLSPDSRIWIYQSNRFLTPEEEAAIKIMGQQFVDQWTAHNNNLLGSIEILSHLFLIVGVDESVNNASGCSIDKSLSFVKSLEKQFNLDWFNRRAVAFEKNGKIEISDLLHFEKLFKDGYVNKNDVMYNNLVATKGHLETHWKIPVNESWLMQVI